MKQTFLFILVTTFLLVQTSCIKTDTSSAAGSSLPDPNGPWLITIPQGDHCFAPASTKLITVSGDQFDAILSSYTRNGCTETISIKGSITKGNLNFVVTGNETISGGCCNGINGFFKYIDPSKTLIKGDVQSNWGILTFEKK